jgi:succinate dehydrogenase / fumarate reductase flavoprotein subunit
MVRFRTNGQIIIIILLTPNKRNLDVIVVGTGLAGGSASATLAELGYNVKSFVSRFTRRAHSIAAQGGINAAKNYRRRRFRFRLFTIL